jgi:hypothetical protein
MEVIMNQLRRFMYGRYGFDQYTRALVFLSLFLSLITTFTRIAPLFLVAYIPLIYAVFRTLSKNISKRSQENMAYYRIETAVKSKFSHSKMALVGDKTHKYYKCPQCKQTIRVPRGKGKICITCPKCRREFIKKT